MVRNGVISGPTSAGLSNVIYQVGKGQLASVEESPLPCVDTEGTVVDVEALMTRLAQAGVTTLIKADDERLAEGGETWTVMVSGAGLGTQGGIRAESADLRSGLRDVLSRLAERPGDWSWLGELRELSPQ
ncbi:hypothetical protein [Amycolatopsis sp. SID8362]|uniref:hypothetical protein n=1 Tax=Amycolatopsis sp. SID8362 TaxID=2690346 RepID=UPI001EF2C49E|nr:hypothetical protein [Amycolatopsis sp. SID8362]